MDKLTRIAACVGHAAPGSHCVEASFGIPLPPSREPPELVGGLLNTEIAIPWKLCNRRASGGVEDVPGTWVKWGSAFGEGA